MTDWKVHIDEVEDGLVVLYAYPPKGTEVRFVSKNLGGVGYLSVYGDNIEEAISIMLEKLSACRITMNEGD